MSFLSVAAFALEIYAKITQPLYISQIRHILRHHLMQIEQPCLFFLR